MLETLAVLRSERGAAVLRDIASRHSENVLALSAELRAQGYEPELVSAALTQTRLRNKARGKLGADAEQMFFLADRLEQASRAIVTQYRASRLVRAGASNVIDIGCGVGADLIGFARAGLSVIGIDIDETAAALADANIHELSLAETARAHLASSDDLDLSTLHKRFDTAFCDPARRSGSNRVFHHDQYQPSWRFVIALAQALPRTCVKVAPGIAHAAIDELVRASINVEAEWISADGDLVEAALWCTPRQQPHRTMTATLLTGNTARSLSGSGERQAPTGLLGAYLYDPNPAVTRAGLVAELCEELGAHLLDPSIAYLSNDTGAPSTFARSYSVIEALPFSVKRLRAWLAPRDIGVVEIKKRGFAMTPEELRPQLRLRGKNSATIVLTRINEAPTAIMCQPYSASGPATD